MKPRRVYAGKKYKEKERSTLSAHYKASRHAAPYRRTRGADSQSLPRRDTRNRDDALP